MAQLEFPDNPVMGATHIHGPKVWRYGGEGWICISDIGTQVWYSVDPPEDWGKYPLWFDTGVGELKLVYQDVDSVQWIKLGPGGFGESLAGASYLDQLLDVDTTGKSVGDVIEWDGNNWVNVPNGAGAGVTEMDDLTDADTTTSPPSTNDFLTWDDTNWIPYTLVTTDWDTAYTHSQSAHAPTNADNTSANETSHSDVVVDGDFTVNGFMIRNGSGSYTVDTSTYLTQAQVDARVTAVETSHSDVVQDGDFSANGFLKRTSLGVYTVDTSTYLTQTQVDARVTAIETQLAVEDEGSPLTANATKLNFAGTGVTVTEPVADEMLVTISSGSGSDLEVEDEGVSLSTAVTKINFVGTGVTATEPVADEVLVTISGGSGVSELDDLSDVDLTTTAPVTDDILEFDGTNFVPVANTSASAIIEHNFSTQMGRPSGATARYAHTRLPFNNLVESNNVDAGTGTNEGAIVIPTSGVWEFNGQVRMRDHSTTFSTTALTIRVNGSIYRYGNYNYNWMSGVTDDTIKIHLQKDLDAGDVVDVGYYTNQGSVIVSATTDGGTGYDFLDGSPDTITTTSSKWGSVLVGDTVTISGSTSNDGVYIVASATATVITLKDSLADGSLTTESDNTTCTIEVNRIPWVDYGNSLTYFSGKLLSPSVIVAPNGINHGFHVDLGGTSPADDWTITGDAWTEVPWARVKWQENVNFDLTNNRFTAPSSGIYQFSATCQGNALVADERLSIGLLVNGTFVASGSDVFKGSATSNNGRSTTSATIKLNVGDHVTTKAIHGGSGSEIIDGAASVTYFTGHKVSGTSTGVEYDNYDIAFRAYDSTGTTINDGGNTTIDCDTTVYDKGNNFDTVNSKFIAPVSGVYSFNGACLASLTALTTGIFQTSLHINDVVKAYGVRIDQLDFYNSHRSTVSTDFYLEAGDEVKLVVYYDATPATITAQTGERNTYFSGHLIKSTTKAESSFRVHRNNVDQTHTTISNWEKVEFTHASFNIGNNFDTTTDYEFTAPEDGRYVFTYRASLSTLATAGTTFTVGLFIDDTLDSMGTRNDVTSGSTVIHASNGNDIVTLTKGQTVDMRVYQSESTSETILGNKYHTSFSGYRLVSSQDTPKNTTDLSDVSSLPAQASDILKYNAVTEVYEPTQVLQDEVSFKATQTSDSVSLVTSTPIQLPYTTEEFDNGSNYDTTTSEFTCPVDGTYTFKASVLLDTTSLVDQARIDMYFKKNSATVNSSANTYATSGSGYQTIQGDTTIECLEDDVIEVWLINYHATTFTTFNGATSHGQFEGHLLTPAVVLAPNGVNHAFSVYKSGNQSVTDTAPFNTKLTWQTARYEKNLSFDFTNNQFVAPSDGIYKFDCAMQFNNDATGNFIFSLVTSNGSFEGQRRDVSGFDSQTVSASTYLKAGETAWVGCYASADSSYTIRGDASSRTWFSGYKVSGTSTGIEYDKYDIAFSVDVGSQYTQSVGIGSEHRAELDTVNYDKGGNFDTTNYEFVVPVDGIYHFDAMHHAIGCADQERVLVKITKNGASLTFGESSISTATTTNSVTTVGDTFSLVAGDEISLTIQVVGEASIRDTGNITQLSGYLIEGTTKAECSFEVNNGGVAQTGIVHTTFTNVVIGSANSNIGNNFDVANNKFVAPEDGRYQMNAIFLWHVNIADAERVDGQFLVDPADGGANYAYYPTTSTTPTNATYGYATSRTDGILNLKKGDEVYFQVRHFDTSATRDGYSSAIYTTWSGYRLVSSQDLATQKIGELNDVDTDTTAPVAGDLLEYDGSNWIPVSTVDKVAFPATPVQSADANTLDHYEEGTWTPTLDSGATTTPDATTDSRYTRIGRMVVVQCQAQFGSITVNGTAIKIGGLPFISDGIYYGSIGDTARAQYTSSGHNFILLNNNTTQVLFKFMTANSGNEEDLLSQASGTYTPSFGFSLTYFTDT